MKNYLSSLVLLALFLNVFSSLAMHKEVEHIEMGNNSEYKCNIEDLPDDIAVCKVFPFLDLKSLNSVRNTNKKFRRMTNLFFNHIKAEEIVNIISGYLFDSFSINPEKAQMLVIELESKMRQDRNIFLHENLDNKLKIEDLTGKNVKDELFKIFKNYDPKIVKIFDKIINTLKTLSNYQEILFNKTILAALCCTSKEIEKLLRKTALNLSGITKITISFLLSIFILFILLPYLLLGSTGLYLTTTLLIHNLIIYISKEGPAYKPDNTHYDNFICKLIRIYCDIPSYLRKHLKKYIYDEEKLRKTIYGEQELQKKKNQ